MTGVSVVLDTNILVSALLSPLGNPAKIFKMVLTETLKLVYCTQILAEYSDVLSRPRLQIPTNDAVLVIEALKEYGEQIMPPQSTHDMLDEDDRIFYDTANAAGAYLVTGNTKHYPNETFIVTPAEFLSLE